jgi:putative hemolysin
MACCCLEGSCASLSHASNGAVIDHQFGTTDVLIVMPVSAINARCIEHFSVDASRHAA